MSTDIIDGMVDDICTIAGMNPDKPSDVTKALRWLNESIDEMAKYDFPGITHVNSYFETTGDEVYNIEDPFLRIVDGSVRIGSRKIELVDKSIVDEYDPGRLNSGIAFYCYQINSNAFGLYPIEGSGSTVKLDWVEKPTVLTATIADDDFPFDVQNHWLITDGGRWRASVGLRSVDWIAMRATWRENLKDAVKVNASTPRLKSASIHYTEF